MEDKWTNINMEDHTLRPYQEPPTDYNDPIRLGMVLFINFANRDIVYLH